MSNFLAYKKSADLSGVIDHALYINLERRKDRRLAIELELGKANINIAGMQVARASAGGDALMAITVDSPV